MSERPNPGAARAGGRRGVAAAREPDAVDRRLINALQGDFPLSATPFADVAAALGLNEAEVIARIRAMLDDRVLTRFGPMFQIERMGGAFCLAAMAVPEAQWEAAAEAVNAFPEVAHNYRREHRLNMWFVLATERPGGIADAARRIEAATGLPVRLFPKEREYFVEMKLEA
ncbi:Lrp/AsnC family transcriptional regulator [Thauera linaloolentis]|nr:AsnC family transcriptional regulator [Thauera linaloolentis]MCM8564974.1 AsnC family transcriptional regulator [Thauera linaloolentis]